MNKNNLSTIELIERNRRVSLIGFIATFSCWQLGQIVTLNFSDSIEANILVFFHLLTVVGSLGWVGFSFFLYRSIRLLKKHPELGPQIDDERNRIIRLRAMSYGFVLTVGISSLLFGISFLLDSTSIDFSFGGTFVAQTIMLIGIVSASLAYLVLDNQE